MGNLNVIIKYIVKVIFVIIHYININFNKVNYVFYIN